MRRYPGAPHIRIRFDELWIECRKCNEQDSYEDRNVTTGGHLTIAAWNEIKAEFISHHKHSKEKR